MQAQKEYMRDLKGRIIRFLDTHSYCVISTSSSDTPHSALVRYANDGLIIYSISARERKKVENIITNSKVSAVVYGRSFLIPPRSLAMWGEATILEKDEQEPRRAFRSKRFPNSWINSQAMKRVEKHSRDFVFLKIRPSRMRLNEFRDGFIRGEYLEL